jgi:hypothetical protein
MTRIGCSANDDPYQSLLLERCYTHLLISQPLPAAQQAWLFSVETLETSLFQYLRKDNKQFNDHVEKAALLQLGFHCGTL